MKRLVQACALLVAIFCGCTKQQLDRIDPPLHKSKCDGNNRFLCLDGHSCCTSIYPVCKGPDSEGYYCEPSPDDAEAQILFGTKYQRIRATKRVDE